MVRIEGKLTTPPKRLSQTDIWFVLQMENPRKPASNSRFILLGPFGTNTSRCPKEWNLNKTFQAGSGTFYGCSGSRPNQPPEPCYCSNSIADYLIRVIGKKTNGLTEIALQGPLPSKPLSRHKTLTIRHLPFSS